MKKKNKNPLFLGLTHIGQVFSIGWSEKFGGCSVFDFDKKNLNNFKAGNLTDEEPNLRKLFKKNKKKITICPSQEETKNFENIFLTIDTPLAPDGKANYDYIKRYIERCINLFSSNTNVILTSQVYCGFCEEIKKKIIKNKKINLIYMAETLVMGNALERFLKPERIIFGSEKKIKIFAAFKKFKCPVFILKYKQAEMIKMAINLYLLTSVSYANLLDFYCRQYGFKFSSINQPIRLDKRIGVSSYISPSLGISGGHLERDLFSIINNSKNILVKNTFYNFKILNKKRINVLIDFFKEIKKTSKFSNTIWIGPSYKKDSFSILNSPFYHFAKYMKKNNFNLKVYDSYFNLKKNNIENVINKINENNFKNSILILNYASHKDLNKIIKLANKNILKVIDIEISLNKKTKDKKNIHSLLN